MAYSHNWLKSQQTTDPRATHLAAPSPAHGQDQSDPYPEDHQAPVSPDWGNADFGRTVVQTPGLALDAPNETGHASRAVGGVWRTQEERQAAQARGHEGQDRGWMRATYRAPAFQDDTTRYLEDCWEGNGSYAPSPESIQRGINSLPQNNTDSRYGAAGFRRGLRNFLFVDRKNKLDHRNYTAQPLLARQIRIPHPQPAQDGDGILKTSPFNTFARAIEDVNVSPALFRSPPRLTDTILADQPPVAGGSPVVADSMWGF